MNDSERIRIAFSGGHVRRWHASDILGEERVDSHTWGMLMIVHVLHPSPSVSLLGAITFHDSPAELFGDIPHPAKRAFPTLGEADRVIGERTNRALGFDYEDSLSEEDRWWLAFADMAQAYLFCKRQIALGNSLMGEKEEEIAELVRLMVRKAHAPESARLYANALLLADVHEPLQPNLQKWEDEAK